jgi:putative NADPH-quinone reductase
MKVALVIAHPYEGSFCRALLAAAEEGLRAAGHEADVIDLDAAGFNPVMTKRELGQFVRGRDPAALQREALDPQAVAFAARLNDCDHLALLFPIWWELMPALMKGFIDKVIFPGLFYRYEGERLVKLSSRLKGVTMVTTMNTPSLLYRWVFGGAIRFAVLRGVFWKLGVGGRRWLSFAMVKTAPEARRKAWLERTRRHFEALR